MYSILRRILNVAATWQCLFADRMRAQWARCRGACVGAKTRLGPRLRLDRPGQLSIGAECEFESDVWIKIVCDGTHVEIGDSTFVGRGAEIDAAHRVVIGRHVLLAPGVFVTDHQHQLTLGRRIDVQGCWAAPVVIEDDVWLGVRSVVLPGVRIGQGAVVGAAAVVTHDVPANAIVAGIPARVIRFRDGTVPRDQGGDAGCEGIERRP